MLATESAKALREAEEGKEIFAWPRLEELIAQLRWKVSRFLGLVPPFLNEANIGVLKKQTEVRPFAYTWPKTSHSVDHTRNTGPFDRYILLTRIPLAASRQRLYSKSNRNIRHAQNVLVDQSCNWPHKSKSCLNLQFLQHSRKIPSKTSARHGFMMKGHNTQKYKRIKTQIIMR